MRLRSFQPSGVWHSQCPGFWHSCRPRYTHGRTALLFARGLSTDLDLLRDFPLVCQDLVSSAITTLLTRGFLSLGFIAAGILCQLPFALLLGSGGLVISRKHRLARSCQPPFATPSSVWVFIISQRVVVSRPGLCCRPARCHRSPTFTLSSVGRALCWASRALLSASS